MAGRGMALEKKAEKVNLKWRIEKKALIQKIPTPMRITNKGVIPQPSTVDFVGLLDGGKFIAFDAKQTKVKTRLPLQNIHQHQLDYLKIVQNLGGITFFLVWFTELSKNEAWIVPIGLVEYYFNYSERASIPYEELTQNSKKVVIEDYLKFLEDEEFYNRLFAECIDPNKR